MLSFVGYQCLLNTLVFSGHVFKWGRFMMLIYINVINHSGLKVIFPLL